MGHTFCTAGTRLLSSVVSSLNEVKAHSEEIRNTGSLSAYLGQEGGDSGQWPGESGTRLRALIEKSDGNRGVPKVPVSVSYDWRAQ